jgi:signal transduction histidine kinase
MQSRAEKINGSLKINSLKNSGTTIFVTCPIQKENDE